MPRGPSIVVRWALLAVLIAAVSPANAVAQGPDADDQARIHFQAANEYFHVADYESALREFERAWELSRRPALQYNIYLCHERLGDAAEAAEHLERYLAESPEVSRREVLEQRLDNLRRRASEQAAETTTDHGGDGAGAPDTDHAEPDEPTPRREVPEQPAPAEGAAERSDADRVPAPARSDGGGDGIPLGAGVTLGVGAAALVGLAVFGGLALDAEAEVASLCGVDVRSMCTGDEAAYRRMEHYALLADVSLAVAVVATTAGVVWWILGSAGEEEGAVALAPSVGPRGGGLALLGRLP